MNLLICNSPLQVMIAEKIIDRYPEEDFFSILCNYAEKDNEKFRYYRERLNKKCIGHYDFINSMSNKYNVFISIKRVTCYFRQVKNIDKIFVANIHELVPQAICSNVHFNEIITFDDGLANIVSNSVVYKESNDSIKIKLLRKIFSIGMKTQDIRRLSKKHYSIYHNMPNILSNVEYINLFNIDNFRYTNEQEKNIKILLGQNIYKSDEDNIEISERIINEFKIGYYFPHPREKYKIHGAEYINTNLAFEDYILQNREFNYIIYTFFSSAAINIIGFPNVKVISLFPSLEDNIGVESYNIINKLGVEVINI